MTGAQRKRIALVAILLLAGLVFVRQIVKRGTPSPEAPGQASTSTAPGALQTERLQLDSLQAGGESAGLPQETIKELLHLARRVLESPGLEDSSLESPKEARDSFLSGGPAVLLSLSRGTSTALVVRGRGDRPEDAVRGAARELQQRATPEEIRGGRLKIDVAAWRGPQEHFDSEGRCTAEDQLDGIWLPGPDLLLLPEEILSRRLVDNRQDLQSGRLRRYLEEGGRSLNELVGNPSKSGLPYQRFRFQSAIEGPRGEALPLYRGNLESPPVTAPSLLEAARAGGEYLLRHLHEDGTFAYIYQTKKDSYDDDYNLLRHAGSCYALVELYEATGDDRFLAGARLGLEALLRETRPPKAADEGADFEAIVSPGEEAKLGGAALTVLALMRYQEASGDASWLDRARSLARFMEFQQESSGKFASKYFYGKPDAVPFESIYYPGEAILSSLRLYRFDPDPRWLEIARKGADYLIDGRDAGKNISELPHDHWLLMGLNELYQLTEDPRYGVHGTRIAQAILQAQRTEDPRLDWIGSFYTPPRSTPTATRGEALVAMHSLARALGSDATPYLDALILMARFQLRCQLTAENTLYLPRPDLAHGGFRRSLTNWEVRIDYVQHNISALLGLRNLLALQGEFRSSSS